MATLIRDKPIQEISGLRVNAGRIFWLNDARIFAGFGIVFIHVCGTAMEQVNNLNNFNWWVGNYYAVLAVSAVNIFAMLSGFLLLDPSKDEPIKDFYKKRASKLLLPIVFWSGFFAAWTYLGDTIIDGNPASISHTFKMLLFGTTYPHMWFFYMIIGLYLFTPFLRRIVRLSSYNELVFLCIVLFTFAIVAQAVMSYYSYLVFPSIFWSILFLPFFLTGYLVKAAKTNPSPPVVYLILILSIIITGLGNYFGTRAGNLNLWNPDFLSPLIITNVSLSICVMLLLKKYSRSIFRPSFGNRLTTITLGICLIHPIFLDILRWMGIKMFFYTSIISIPLMAVLVYMLSLLTTMLISKTPLIKRIV
jgi:surface polysaccharide O-acyltransferase-like enzyme